LTEEKIVACVTEFISVNLGQQYIEIPPLDLEKAFKDTTPTSPLIFILSTGSDPVASLIKFASSAKIGMHDKLQFISLGQGQGPIAEKIIHKASENGEWCFLQNCHLAASWMPRLEAIIKEFGQGDIDVNPKFRLILSSMPSRVFPISVLQEGVKVTNEPPKGLKANLVRTFNEISVDLFNDHAPQGVKFRKLVYGICFFNAVIHERKKFGPLGWNIMYDFSNSDVEVSMAILRNILLEYKTIPWEALTYLTGEITFGGRVTDEWDRRTLKSILSRFYTPLILDDNYMFSQSRIYYAPADGDILSFKTYIDALPLSEEPSIFGMHENANISYQLQEARKLIRTVLEVQPRLVSVGAGVSSEDLVSEMCSAILSEWPEPLTFDPDNKDSKTSEQDDSDVPCRPANLFDKDENGRMNNSLSTVLLQESARFNKLHNIVKISLENVTKAVKGLIVMNAELELVFKSLLNNEVPHNWSNFAYPSLKPLGSWVKDFHKRVEMIKKWSNEGQPISFWLPGFFYPQGFLTGVLQNHARKFNIPIDTLQFNFKVKELYDGDANIKESPEYKDDGVFVHGLQMEGARWDLDKRVIQDSHAMSMFSVLVF
jgi:dynein heavy chain